LRLTWTGDSIAGTADDGAELLLLLLILGFGFAKIMFGKKVFFFLKSTLLRKKSSKAW
jgi:hypothetical protein